MATVGSLVVRLYAQTAQFDKSMGDAARKINVLSGTAEQSSVAIASAFVSIGKGETGMLRSRDAIRSIGYAAGLSSKEVLGLNITMSLLGGRGNLLEGTFSRVKSTVVGFGKSLGVAGIAGVGAAAVLVAGFMGIKTAIDYAENALEGLNKRSDDYLALSKSIHASIFGPKGTEPADVALAALQKQRQAAYDVAPKPGADKPAFMYEATWQAMKDTYKAETARFDLKEKQLLQWREELAAAHKVAPALKEHNNLVAEAAKIYESVITPTEKFNAQKAKLNSLLTAGHLTLETHARALAKYREEMTKALAPQEAFGGNLEQLTSQADAMYREWSILSGLFTEKQWKLFDFKNLGANEEQLGWLSDMLDRIEGFKKKPSEAVKQFQMGEAVSISSKMNVRGMMGIGMEPVQNAQLAEQKKINFHLTNIENKGGIR